MVCHSKKAKKTMKQLREVLNRDARNTKCSFCGAPRNLLDMGAAFMFRCDNGHLNA